MGLVLGPGLLGRAACGAGRWIRLTGGPQATERCGPTRAESTCGGRLDGVTVFGSLRKRDGTGTGHGKRNSPMHMHTTVVIRMDWSGNQNGTGLRIG